MQKEFPKMLQHCGHRRDAGVDDLFRDKADPLDVDRAGCGDAETTAGLSAREPDPNLSPKTQQKCSVQYSTNQKFIIL